MRVVGITFTKISGERFDKKINGLKIGNEINVKSIEEVNANDLKLKETLLDVSFYYNVLYEPGLAKISFEGKLLVAFDSKEAKELLKAWKNKTLDEATKVAFFNIVLRKVSIKALEIEEELNLPPHFNLPFLKFDEKESKK